MITRDLCKYIHSGLALDHFIRVHPEDEDTPILIIPSNVAWIGAWLTKSDFLQLPNGKIALDKYVLNKIPLSKKKQTTPSIPFPKSGGWRSKHTSFTTTPINPDLDVVPTGNYEITHHPTNKLEALLHAPDGRLITKLHKARLQNLKNVYTPTNHGGTLPQAVTSAINPQPTTPRSPKHTIYNKTTNNAINRNPTEPGPYQIFSMTPYTTASTLNEAYTAAHYSSPSEPTHTSHTIPQTRYSEPCHPQDPLGRTHP